MTYSVILPTLNEKKHIVQLIEEVSEVFVQRKLDYEIIVVDDNSNDGTIEVIKNYCNKNILIKLIVRENKRKSLPESINIGIKKAKYSRVIWLDADFQHPPKYINEFIKYFSTNDVIVCSRFVNGSNRYFEDKNLNKNINENQSVFFNKLCNFFLFKDITDYTSGFICINKNLLKSYRLKGFYGDYFVNLIFYLKKKKINILEIPFKDEMRASGNSKTVVKINLKYIYTCFRYFVTLIKNILKKLFYERNNKY